MAVTGPLGFHGLEFKQKFQLLRDILEFANFLRLFFQTGLTSFGKTHMPFIRKFCFS